MFGAWIRNMKDIFEKGWNQTKNSPLWFVASLHNPRKTWQEILQENKVPLLHRRMGYFWMHHVWFLDPVNTRDFFARFQDNQEKYDIIFLESNRFLEVWTIKDTPVQPECACRDNLDHTCSDAGDGSITVWYLQRHCGCICCMPATAAPSLPATAASSSLVPVTQARRGG